MSAEDCSSTSNKFLYAHTYTAEKRGGVCGRNLCGEVRANLRDPTMWVRGTLVGFFYLTVLFHQNEFLKVLVDEKPFLIFH
jgi:hypothetical protein